MLVAEHILKFSCNHTGKHHAQCHKPSADSIVSCFMFTISEVDHVKHIGSESKPVAKLLNGNSSVDK